MSRYTNNKPAHGAAPRCDNLVASNPPRFDDVNIHPFQCAEINK